MHIHYCIYPNIPRLLRAVIEGPRVRAHLFGLVAMATSPPRRPIIAGPEFGPERAGKRLILYKSIYGARASCA